MSTKTRIVKRSGVPLVADVEVHLLVLCQVPVKDFANSFGIIFNMFRNINSSFT